MTKANLVRLRKDDGVGGVVRSYVPLLDWECHSEEPQIRGRQIGGTNGMDVTNQTTNQPTNQPFILGWLFKFK